MRIRLTTDLAGQGFILRDGDEADLDSVEAMRLVRAGSAELLDTPKPIESAVPKVKQLQRRK